MLSLRVIIKYAFVILLMIWAIIGSVNQDVFRLISVVNLLIHESGHLILGIFGNFLLTVMGGTLFQLAMPIAFFCSFAIKKDWYSAAIMLFWLGINFFDVAIYIADARRQVLPLISIGAEGEAIIHDWNYMLSYWGLLMHEQTIAQVVKIFGWASFFGGMALGLFTADYSRPAKESTEIASESLLS